METLEQIRFDIINEINKIRRTGHTELSKLSLFDLDRIYHKIKRKEKIELYLATKCQFTFWNKEAQGQECKLKTGRTCEFSKDNIFTLGCREYKRLNK